MLTILPALLAATGAATDLPAVKVMAAPGDGYVITVMPFPERDRARLNIRLIEIAAEKCGERTVRWGSFSSKNVYPRGANGGALVVDYRVNISCSVPPTDAFTPVAADWVATDQDNAVAIAFVNKYLDLYQAGDVRGAAMVEPGIAVAAAEWLKQTDGFRRQLGTGKRELSGPVWRVNPPAATHPGAYASFAFRGSYSGMAAYCGIVILYRQAPDNYQVSGQRTRAATKADVTTGRMSEPLAVRSCEELIK